MTEFDDAVPAIQIPEWNISGDFHSWQNFI